MQYMAAVPCDKIWLASSSEQRLGKPVASLPTEFTSGGCDLLRGIRDDDPNPENKNKSQGI